MFSPMDHDRQGADRSATETSGDGYPTARQLHRSVLKRANAQVRF